MRSIEDKEISTSNAINCEFHKSNGGNRSSHHRTGLGKPTPSKWDDAQKWLVSLSRGGERSQSKTKPRNSNADDRRLIAPVPKKEDNSSGEEEGDADDVVFSLPANPIQYEADTKKVDSEESIWRINKPSQSNSTSAVRSICVRDMGTEMTPIASQEPSRTGTPIRATTPASRSPNTSGPTTPMRALNASRPGQTLNESRVETSTKCSGTNWMIGYDLEEFGSIKANEYNNSEQVKAVNTLETRAIAWDEAERAKYMARYKREEVKIQAWENHEKRRAEMEMKRMEVKAERLKARAEERLANKLVATRRIAEEKRANAEAKLNEKAVKTSERADHIRRTGHLPSSFSFKLPSLCW